METTGIATADAAPNASFPGRPASAPEGSGRAIALIGGAQGLFGGKHFAEECRDVEHERLGCAFRVPAELTGYHGGPVVLRLPALDDLYFRINDTVFEDVVSLVAGTLDHSIEPPR